MALHRVTAKNTYGSSPNRIEKGMSVEVVSTQSARPLMNEIAAAFRQKYGVDAQKAGSISTDHLTFEKLS